MNSDIRIKISFASHLKRRRLQFDLGAEGVLGLVDLWLYMAENRPHGDLTGMSAEEIALAANYGQNADFFLSALVKCNFVDETLNSDGTVSRRLHGWEKHNAWAANSEKRSEAARELAKKRWSKRLTRKGQNAKGNAVRMRDALPTACETHCGAHTVGNAPSPNPSPNPSPSPIPFQYITTEEIKRAKNELFTEKEIVFDYQTGKFLNLDDEKFSYMKKQFPAISVDEEILKAEAWAKANPKNRKSDWFGFIVNWLTRSQDKAPVKRGNEYL